MAMVANYFKVIGALDKNGDGFITPDETSAYSTANGYRTANSGTSWGFFGGVSKVLNLQVQQYDPYFSVPIIDSLKKGIPVIASMKPGHFTQNGHYIVLAGLTSDGKVIVRDPNSTTRSEQSWDYLGIIQREAGQFWVFSK
jgi:hypothetical protein